MYLALKYLHIVCVAASFALLFVRGLWVLRAFPPAPEAWVRVTPHVIDGILIVSAIGMLLVGGARGWPDWLSAKLALAGLFVVLTVAVFRLARSRLAKAVFWFAAMLVFLFITTVAVLQHPAGIFNVIH